MEYEMVRVKVPKGMVKEGMQLVVAPGEGNLRIGNVYCPGIGACSVFLTPKPLKPEWSPPRLKKGWLTWCGNEDWWWWESQPEYREQFGCWSGGGGQKIVEVMAEFLQLPGCTGFDERNCIWEVGE